MKHLTRAAMVAFILTIVLQASASAGSDYILDNGDRLPISQTYTYKTTISQFGSYGSLNLPEDMYIDKNDNLYITDTGNNSVLVLNSEGNVARTFSFDEGDQRVLNGPSGVFADDDGNVYIGDTMNKRILHLSEIGEFVEEFSTPTSSVLGSDFIYSPRRIAVTNTGYIYTIKEQSLMKIDTNNSFQGYIGATKLGFSLKGMFIRLFASKQQKEKLLTAEPPPYLSFALAKDGKLYATTTDLSSGQIMKLDVTGANMFPSVFYGEYSTDDEGNVNAPYFADIAADVNSFVTAIDQRTGKLYQYDKDGNLLTVFGYGLGKKQGQLSLPVAVDVDSKGNIYVLDSQLGCIIVYEPTAFIESIHNAVSLYADGRYDEAKDAFAEVLAIDGNYDLAYEGMGRILVKQQNYTEAMTYYKLANNTGGYSAAFSKYRHEIFRNNFIWVVLITAAVCLAIYFLVRYLKRRSSRIRIKFSGHKINRNVLYFLPLTVCMLFEPQEVCYIVKRDRKRFSFLSIVVTLVLAVTARILAIAVTHYPLATKLVENTSLWWECAIILVPLITWAVAQYAVTAIFTGEAKFGEILTLSTFSMVPYIVFSVPIALLSRILCQAEAGFYNALLAVMWIWTAVLLLICLKASNDYTFGKMLLVTLVTLCAMLLIWAVIVLMVAMGSQFMDFIKGVITELGYAVERGTGQ